MLRDVGLTLQVNGGFTPAGFPIDRVFLEGAELAWSVPRFAVFNTQLEPIFGEIGYAHPLFIVVVYSPAIAGVEMPARLSSQIRWPVTSS